MVSPRRKVWPSLQTLETEVLIVYKALRLSVFLEPKKLKVDELKEALQKREVTVDQREKKTDLIKALDKWIQNVRKKSKCSHSVIIELPLDKGLKKSLALVAVGSDLLMVSDVAARRVYQVAITNNGACLQGTVTLVMKFPKTSEPFDLTCYDSQLFVADSSREGGITKLNLTTLKSDKLVRNGSDKCHTVHALAVTKERHQVFRSQTQRFSNCSAAFSIGHSY